LTVLLTDGNTQVGTSDVSSNCSEKCLRFVFYFRIEVWTWTAATAAVTAAAADVGYFKCE